MASLLEADSLTHFQIDHYGHNVFELMLDFKSFDAFYSAATDYPITVLHDRIPNNEGITVLGLALAALIAHTLQL